MSTWLRALRRRLARSDDAELVIRRLERERPLPRRAYVAEARRGWAVRWASTARPARWRALVAGLIAIGIVLLAAAFVIGAS